MQTADRVRQILSTRGLTLYQVSQRSAEFFGPSSPHYIPQRLYQELATGALSPNIHQLIAFSRVTNYRLCDWLAVFGFRLDDIPRLQLEIAWRRTVLLDSSVYDEDQWIPWFVERPSESALPGIVPLAQALKLAPSRRASELLALNKRRFLYVKVGSENTFAYPDLMPGSIARIDVRRKPDPPLALGASTSKSIFLVENGLFLHCGHLRSMGKNRIVLCSTHFPFAQVELTLGRNVRILGMVDAEIRPVVPRPASEIGLGSTAVAKADVPVIAGSRADLQQLLRTSRMRVGLSFREASAISQRIARELADEMYFAAPGTLSDYENLASPLRHVQKIISLCILYCIDFWSFLRTGGLPLEFLGSDPLPDELGGRIVLLGNAVSDEVAGSGPLGAARKRFLSTLIDQWEELPLFTKDALPGICRLKDISLSDIFWVDMNQHPTHPCLAGAAFVAVNRRLKTPLQSTVPTVWEQPLYMVLRRDGTYLCGTCVLQRGVLIIRPQSEQAHSPIELRNGVDAEVIGQVTAILRRLN
jgi:hypothetical protein